MSTIGIGDISFFIPPDRINLPTLLEFRSAQQPDQARRFHRALETTGQRGIRFPGPGQDVVSMAANAAIRLLKRNLWAIAGLRHLVAGTETSPDHSKPLSNWVLGLLRLAGLEVPTRLSSFQVQHACASATLGLLSGAALLGASDRAEETGLVLASDIARYQAGSTAEFTQGAGAAAILLEHNPRLLALAPGEWGFSSEDVDDFFRPLGSPVAMVKGQYSMKCYHQAAESALEDFSRLRGQTPRQVLESHQGLIFHVPFARMAYTAARHLLSVYLNLVDGEIDHFLEELNFFRPLDYTAWVGNIYSGSIWLNLAAWLKTSRQSPDSRLSGKSCLFFSYGSGNVMAVFSATLQDQAELVVDSWDHGPEVLDAQEASLGDYLEWLDNGNPGQALPKGPPGLVCHTGKREDGYREYGIV